MADIFLSYRRTDRDRVEPIAALLEARGWSVWWDARVDAGEQWDEVIEREIDAARCVVAVWSCESVGSRWVRAEASEGLERGILVPVLIDPARPSLEFKRLHSIDLTNWRGGAGEAPAKALVGAAARLVGQGTARAEHTAGEPRQRRDLLAGLHALGRRAALPVGRAMAVAGAGIAELARRVAGIDRRVALAGLAAILVLAGLPALRWSGWLGGRCRGGPGSPTAKAPRSRTCCTWPGAALTGAT